MYWGFLFLFLLCQSSLFLVCLIIAFSALCTSNLLANANTFLTCDFISFFSFLIVGQFSYLHLHIIIILSFFLCMHIHLIYSDVPSISQHFHFCSLINFQYCIDNTVSLCLGLLTQHLKQSNVYSTLFLLLNVLSLHKPESLMVLPIQYYSEPPTFLCIVAII